MVLPTRPRIVVTYCRQCGWLLRAAWLAQELLATFAEELGEVALVPGTGGVLTLELDGELLFDRRRDAGLPDLAALKPAGARPGGAGARSRPCRAGRRPLTAPPGGSPP